MRHLSKIGALTVMDRRRFVAGALAAACVLALPRWARADDPAGRVNGARGTATGLLNGSIRELKIDSEVFLQELVQTQPKARLSLALGKTRVDLGERTRVRIEKSLVATGGQILLQRGAMLFDRPDEEPEGDAVVRTPFAIVAARGTRFFVGPSKDVIGVFVERGIVDVRNNGGRVRLGPGEGTDLSSPDEAPTEPARWSAERISAALASVGY